MRVRITYILWIAAMLVLSAASLHAQRYPERKDIRSGNREYEQANYPQCEVSYLRALTKNPDSYEAQFNLGNSLYRQERYDESAQIFQRLAQDTTRIDHIAQCHYNTGNALFKQRKLQESLEAYKNSLRKNPSDMDAKFNLAYVKKMLDNEQNNGGGNNEQNNDQNQDQNQDKDKDQQDKDQDKQDQNQDKGDDKQDQDKGDDKQDKQDQGDQDKDKGKNDDKPKPGEQPQQQGMTQAEAQQMLDAIQAQEDRTQDKVDEKKKAAVVGRSARNW